MLRTIELHGALGKKFGYEHNLDVNSIPEVIRALGYQLEGFFDMMSEGSYSILRDGKAIGEEHLQLLFGGVASICIIPEVEGEKGKSGAAKLILGLVIIVASIVTFGAAGAFAAGGAGFASTASIGAASLTLGQIVGFGGLIALGGIAQILSPTPEVGDNSLREPPKQRASFLLNSQVNTTEEGGPVPLIYGKTMAGTIVVSAGIFAEEIDTDLSSVIDSDFFTEIEMVMDEASDGLYRGFHVPTSVPRLIKDEPVVVGSFGQTIEPRLYFREEGYYFPEDFAGSIDPGTVNSRAITRLYEHRDPVGYAEMAFEAHVVGGSGDTTNTTIEAKAGNPRDAFPTPSANGDHYVVANGHPFQEISIEVTTAGVDGVVVWEYYTGLIWKAISGITDDTNGFTTLGTNLVTWARPSDEGLNGKGYSIRARTTSTLFTTIPRVGEVTTQVRPHEMVICIAGTGAAKNIIDSVKIEDEIGTVYFDQNINALDAFSGPVPTPWNAVPWVWFIDDLDWALPAEGTLLIVTIGYST